MSSPTVIPSDVIIGGNLSAASMTLSTGSVADTNVASNAKIASSKLQNARGVGWQLNGPTTTITTQTQWLLAIKGASGNLIDLTATIAVVGSGGGMSVTVDLKKANGSGGSFSSVLSAPITINSSTTIQTPVAATITGTTLVAGDILEAVVTATAGGGTLPQGLLLTLRWDETYT